MPTRSNGYYRSTDVTGVFRIYNNKDKCVGQLAFDEPNQHRQRHGKLSAQPHLRRQEDWLLKLRSPSLKHLAGSIRLLSDKARAHLMVKRYVLGKVSADEHWLTKVA